MKLKSLAAAIAAVGAFAAANNAAALVPADVATADVKLFMSGATAQDPALKAYVTNVCLGNGSDLITMSNGTTAPGSANSAYLCTVDPAELPTLGDRNGDGVVRLAVFKRSSGGSAYGVGPVLNPAATDAVARLDPSSCGTLIGANHYQCTGTVLDTPEAGISDVEPSLFTGANLLKNLPEDPHVSGDAGTVALIEDGGYTASTLNAVTFGIIVTQKLRDALQMAQGLTVGSELEADMPSLTQTEVASLFGGSIPSWDRFMVGNQTLTSYVQGNGGTIPTNLKVNICRRAQGSGTQAQFNALFFNSPCHSNAIAPLNDNTAATSRLNNTTSYSGAVFTNIGTAAGLAGVASTAPAVHENMGSGDLEACMSRLNSSTVSPWGIGINSTERGSGGSKVYRFVKIAGVAPTLENVANNIYFDWAGASIQWRTSPYAGGVNNVPSADQLALLNGIKDTAVTPSDLATANATYAVPAGADYAYGNLAFPNTSAGFLPSFPFAASNPVMTAQRVASGKPNTCTPAKIINQAGLVQ